jgi:hypothetical protein
MIAGAVLAGRGIDMIQSANDLNLVLQGGERIHRRAELEILAFALWPPILLVHTVGNREKYHPPRRGSSRNGVLRHSGDLGCMRPARQQRGQGGQRNRRPQAA